MKTIIKCYRYYFTYRLLTSSTELGIVATYVYNHEDGNNNRIAYYV